MFQHVAFIVNPIAGSSACGALVGRLASRIRRAGGRASIVETDGAGRASDLARGLGDDVDLIVAVGGDGTVRDIVHGRLDRPVPIATLSAGTENIVARHLGYRASFDSLWAGIAHGTIRRMDVGEVNGRCFLIVVGAGFDAEVVRRVTAARRGHITRADYAWPIWRTFWSYRFPPMRVEADGRTVFEGRGLVMAGNLPRYGADLHILRDARDDDGLLDLCIFRCGSHERLLVHSLFTALRRHVGRRDVIYTQGRHIRIESAEPARGPARSIDLQADGDCAGALPADIRIRPRAAMFCVPPT